jgi:hypothetical protein
VTIHISENSAGNTAGALFPLLVGNHRLEMSIS